eukprot:361903-Chlamydomonas_euryale.AAC.3
MLGCLKDGQARARIRSTAIKSKGGAVEGWDRSGGLERACRSVPAPGKFALPLKGRTFRKCELLAPKPCTSSTGWPQPAVCRSRDRRGVQRGGVFVWRQWDMHGAAHGHAWGGRLDTHAPPGTGALRVTQGCY